MNEAKKRLTVNQWKDIESKYQSGAFTLDELSKEYGASYRAIQSHLNKKGLSKGAIAGAVNPMATKENYSETTRRILCKLANAIEEAIDEIKPGQGRAAQIQRLTAAASKLFSSAEKVGLISEEDDLPILHVIEITADQIERMREEQRDEDAELELSSFDEEERRDYEAEGIVVEGFHDD